MAHIGTTSIRVRDDDYEAAKKVSDGYPIDIINVMSVWRASFELLPPKRQQEMLRRVPRVRRGRRPEAVPA